MEVYKVIRDSVHGNIELDKSLVEYILDTSYFQRLRRIEQTSVRAIYPCARHDRFTHSLGVYHVGTKIASHLRSQIEDIKPLDKTQIEVITKSYLIACLLHDIAHAPFSHTFEQYYGERKALYKSLCTHLDKKSLGLSRLHYDNIKEHEYASAILVADKFKDDIQTTNRLGGDLELICRMIIGAHYSDNTPYSQVCNCFIDLLHGDVDADRLDYACRDIWSSGYKSVSIDINRVIHAMHIKLHNGIYKLCFTHNVVGDIRNIMELKRFQSSHIFNHHTIVYDQELLVQAAETMAKDYAPARTKASKALSNIICYDAVSGEKEIKNQSRTYILKHLCDDDLFSLMKQSNNDYFNELTSRKYNRFALWKSPEEFFKMFPEIDKSINISHKKLKSEIAKALKPLKIAAKHILAREVTYKEIANLDKLLIVVHEDVKLYRDICHEIFKDKTDNNEFVFTYVYLPKPKDLNNLDKIRKEAIEKIKPVIDELFKLPPIEKNAIVQIREFLKEAGCKADILKSSFTKEELEQLKKIRKKISKKSESPIGKATIELLTFIISSQQSTI